MADKNDKILELLVKINDKASETETHTKLQAGKIDQIDEKLKDIKEEQTRQNVVVADHERRSTASEGRMGILEDKHGLFEKEHEEFKKRISVAEQPGLVIKNIWKALITLGAGAGAMFVILKLLNSLK